MRLLVDSGLGIWINALRDLIGKLGDRLIRAVGRMGMIGSEREGDRVIDNYGMKREPWVFFTLLHFTFGGKILLPSCYSAGILSVEVMLELDWPLIPSTCWTYLTKGNC